MLEFDVALTSTGGQAALTAVPAGFSVLETVVYFSNDTLATTQSIRIETAPDSTGPWVTEASTTISTVGSTSGRFRITGPYGFIRPVLQTASTGTYRVRIIGVS